MTNQFCCQSEEGIKKIEEFLVKNAYLSGEQLPGSEDAKVLESQTQAPCRKSYPNFFSWWWNLCGFSQSARELWGGCKKTACKEEKKEEKKVAQDEDELDLFGDDNEEDLKAQEKLKVLAEYNKKNASKLAAQESRVVMEVKGFEVE